MSNEKDYGASWFRAAAEEGNVIAQNEVGIMYAKGEGLPQDYVQAHMWFSLSRSRKRRSSRASGSRSSRRPCAGWPPTVAPYTVDGALPTHFQISEDTVGRSSRRTVTVVGAHSFRCSTVSRKARRTGPQKPSEP